ncbi:hypothetical protein J2790_001812 [Paenarthrobacter nicotinovorans]|uniref:hypothetical protein n=1 Tax=Micrococcaceae TaxID=1268 RepID=UPI0008760AFA|nr:MULTISPECIES: hypothetical protein [Micrococcaceae]MDR6436691.1 hypothetical protein [Paenarthrobacter nicotinovorans]SCZ56894.1 hypothetical protein SAMN02799638_02001 [Arthrobacter sp. UNCCL28]
MKSTTVSIIAGVALITMGALLLLDRLGIVESGVFAPLITFTGLGSVFVALFILRRGNWWAAIPGSVFLGLSAVMAATRFMEGVPVGAFLFLFMAAGFGAVYLRERNFWWALIPCGLMSALALVAFLPPELQGTSAAAVLFLGLAATFGLLSVVPVRLPNGTEGNRTGRMRWPLIPAAVLGMLGVTFAFQSAVQIISGDVVVLAVVILAGLELLAYGYHAHNVGQRSVHGH